ncbi:MAG: hypothetical protein AAFS10_26980, partial [Myxococcota bacterium]
MIPPRATSWALLLVLLLPTTRQHVHTSPSPHHPTGAPPPPRATHCHPSPLLLPIVLLVLACVSLGSPILPTPPLAAQPTFRVAHGHQGWVTTVDTTPNGHLAISGSGDRTVRLWDLTSGRLLRTLDGHSGTLRAAALSPNGQFALTGGDDRTLRLWEVATGRLLMVEPQRHPITAVAFSPGGLQAFSASGRTIHTWDPLRQRQTSTTTHHRYPIHAIALS